MTKREFKELRHSIGYTQAQLAKQFGVYVRSVTRWETGEFPIPKMAELALRYLTEHATKKGKR